MDELEALEVYGETPAGWCAATPPNEFVDTNGALMTEWDDFCQPDPRAPAARVYDDPDVVALRARLKATNGLKGLEIVGPEEVDRARRIFFRDGFVVVRDALSPSELERFREGSVRVLRQILEIRGEGGRKYLTETARLPHRYSYGTASASRQLLHEAVWASMIDLATTTPILEAIFGGGDYKLWGAGGDLCLPGAIEYQVLHADFRPDWSLSEARIALAERLGLQLARDVEGSLEPHARQLVIEHTPQLVTINFLMSDLTWENGPIRQIPGTQGLARKPPTLADEPEWMRLSTLVGAKAGAAVFRDNRAWHGATPNLSREIRAMPNVEYLAPWFEHPSLARTMPHEVWESLTDKGKRIAARAKADPGVWPAGAGVMHPLLSRRREARAAAAVEPAGSAGTQSAKRSSAPRRRRRSARKD
jgi:hypothetical protein